MPCRCAQSRLLNIASREVTPCVDVCTAPELAGKFFFSSRSRPGADPKTQRWPRRHCFVTVSGTSSYRPPLQMAGHMSEETGKAQGPSAACTCDTLLPSIWSEISHSFVGRFLPGVCSELSPYLKTCSGWKVCPRKPPVAFEGNSPLNAWLRPLLVLAFVLPEPRAYQQPKAAACQI